MKKLLPFCGLLFFGWCLALSAHAASSPAEMRSLFFNDEEMDRIERENSKADVGDTSRDANNVSLGAILYYGPHRWTVWLQGEKWTPETHRPDFQILDVSPGSVRLRVTPKDNAATQEITLCPYQTYHFSSGKITEGEP